MKKLQNCKIATLVLMLVLVMACFTGSVSADTVLNDGTYVATTPANENNISYKLTVTIENGKLKNTKFSPYSNRAGKVELTYDVLSRVPDSSKASFKKMLDDAKAYSEQLEVTADAAKVTKLPDSEDAYNALQAAWQDIVSQAQ